MSYNTEDKITLEELSPSLQNLLKSAASKTEVTNLTTRVNKLISLLSGVKFEVVDNLDEILLPENGKNMAVCGSGTTYYLYFYYNNKWNQIPTAVMDMNKEYIITINQSAHQTISAKYNGVIYTNSFKAKINGEIEVSIVAEEGYTAGSLTCPAFFPVVQNATLSASSATAIPTYTIDVTPRSHQSIQILYNGTLYANKDVSGVQRGSSYSATNVADYGWNKGDLTVSSNSSLLYESTYLITGDTTVTVSAATRKTYTITVQGTQNQEMTLVLKDPDTSTSTSHTISTLTETFEVPYETKYTVTAVGTNGYLPGNLSTTEGTVTTDFSITISSAQKTYNKELFNDAGTFSWTSPYYITKVHLQIAGAGGGAHSESSGESSVSYFNGGNGELLDYVVAVNPNTTYSLVVGKAGESFVSSGGASIAFNVTANGGGVDGTDAGNGKGGAGDIVQTQTGAIMIRAKNGYMSLEYGTNIEQREVD